MTENFTFSWLLGWFLNSWANGGGFWNLLSLVGPSVNDMMMMMMIMMLEWVW